MIDRDFICTFKCLSFVFSGDLNERIANILKCFTFDLFCNVCRSLFEKHKLHFAFLVCARIRISAKLIDSVEWKHFLTEVVPILVRIAIFFKSLFINNRRIGVPCWNIYIRSGDCPGVTDI